MLLVYLKAYLSWTHGVVLHSPKKKTKESGMTLNVINDATLVFIFDKWVLALKGRKD